MLKKLASSIIITSLALTSINTFPAQAKTKEKKIPVQFLGINDLHGYIEGNNNLSEDGKKIGGMDSLAYHFQKEQASFSKKNKLKSLASNSVLIQSGDLVGGSPAISNLLQDEPTMNAANAIGFHFGTLGNHEFDEGINEFKRLITGEAPSYDTNNYENVYTYPLTTSKSKILISNVINKKSKKLVGNFKPYAIKKVDGVKVGYIGVVTPNIKEIVMAQHMKNIEVIDPAKAVAKYTKELRKKGVKAIVLIAHTGANMNVNANTSINTQKTANVTGDVVSMLKGVHKLDPKNSIDIVFAGHSHRFANGTYKKTRIVQALSYSDAYSKVNGVLSSKTKDFIKTPTAEIKYNYTVSTKTLKKNKVAKKVNGIITDAKKRVAPTINSSIATMNTARINSVPATNRFGSELGNIVADAQLKMAQAKGYKADFALTNTGGIRTDLIGVKSGANYKITWGAAQSVQPFNNFLQHIQLTGAQITKALNSQFNNGDKKLEVAGLHYTYNDDKIIDVFIGDSKTKISATKTYNVIVNDYLSGGKDNYTIFKHGKNLRTIAIDTEIFIDYLTATKNLNGNYKTRAAYIK